MQIKAEEHLLAINARGETVADSRAAFHGDRARHSRLTECRCVCCARYCFTDYVTFSPLYAQI